MPIAFSLPPVPGAVAYRLQIAPDERYAALLFDQVFPSPDFAGPAAPDGTYTWRVRAIDARGLEGLDASKNLTLDARPPAPTDLRPEDRETLPDQRPGFDWQEAEGAATYRFQLADNEGFENPRVDLAGLTATELTPEANLAPGPYYWRVASTDAAGDDGPWSAPRQVEVEAGSGALWRVVPFVLLPIVVLVLLL